MIKVAQGWVLSWAPPVRMPSSELRELARAEAISGKQQNSSNLSSSAGLAMLQQEDSTAPSDESLDTSQLAYSIELKEKTSSNWITFATSREQSYLLKDLRPGAEYQFRVFAHSPAGLKGAPSPEFRYQIPDNRRKPGLSQAFSATVTSGLLFFIACIVIAVCGVNMCNKRRKKRAEKGE